MRRVPVVCFAVAAPLLSALAAAQAPAAQTAGQITGVVTIVGGGPLPAAQVRVGTTALGAQTDAEGRFRVTGVPTGAHTLRVLRIGYAPQSQMVTVTAGQATTANFQLAAQATQLEAVVSIGYGTQRRAELTGTVASVSGEDLTARAAPTSAISNALVGKAAGVQVVQSSGVPGAGATVRVRGTNSITANSEPLYVIDGIPAVQGSNVQDSRVNPLNSIDPNDIESIDILKDASSTAIYGSRGANGVVLITTKRGTRGSNRVSLETSIGTQEINRRIDVLTAPEYRTLVNEARANAGISTPRYTADQINVPSYNYVGMLLRRGAQQNHALSVSGGDDRTRYLVSGNFSDQQGIVIGSEFKRYGMRFNLDREVGRHFRVGNSIGLTQSLQRTPGVDNGGLGAGSNGLYGAMVYDPATPPKDSLGRWIPFAVLSEQVNNPLATARELLDNQDQRRLLGNVYGEYSIGDALRLRSTVGANVFSGRNPFFAPNTIAAGITTNGVAQITDQQSTELTSDNTATYRRAAGPGSLEVLAGFSAQNSDFELLTARSEGLISSRLTVDNLGAATGIRPSASRRVQWTLLSYLGRANYNIGDRYLFTFSSRYDGSSRFGRNNKWAFFPSGAVAWRAINEGFMRDQKLFSDLKLRLSYGRTGNQGIDPYQSLAALTPEFAAIGAPATEQPALAPAAAAPNPDLRWETQDQLNAGVDLAFLDNRVSITADAYQSQTQDLLLSVPLARVTGFSSQLRNIGSVRNRGVEFAINTVNVARARFEWRSTLNLAANRNRVTSLGGVQSILPGTRSGNFIDGGQTHIIQVGQPLGTFYGFRATGLYQQGDACALRDAAACTPGEIKYVDVNGDSIVNSADRIVLGSADPKFYGGFNNRMSFGPLSLDVSATYSQGNKVLNAARLFGSMSRGFLNERREVLDRWTPTNTNTTIPRANANRLQRVSDLVVEDGSFLRLQTVTLGYELPRRFVRGVESTRLYVTGQNVLLFTDYNGFDPEASTLGGDARLRGLDQGVYPRARSWNVGLTANF